MKAKFQKSLRLTIIKLLTLGILLPLPACYEPMPRFDFSRLGNNPLDEIIKNHVIRYDSITGYSDTEVSDNLLKKDIDTYVKNIVGDSKILTIDSIKELGAVCYMIDKLPCTYSGTIKVKYHYNFINDSQYITTRYDISFYTKNIPIIIAVTRKNSRE